MWKNCGKGENGKRKTWTEEAVVSWQSSGKVNEMKEMGKHCKEEWEDTRETFIGGGLIWDVVCVVQMLDVRKDCQGACVG